MGGASTAHTYVFDAGASTLAVQGSDGIFSTVQASTRTPAPSVWTLDLRQRVALESETTRPGVLSPGTWMLALRLTRPGDRGVQEIVAIVPVVRFEVLDDGTVTSPQLYETSHGWRPT